MSWCSDLPRFSLGFFLVTASFALLDVPPLPAQRMPGPEDVTTINNSGVARAPQDVTITIGIRDARGLPIEDMATVFLSSKMRGVHQTRDTKSSADVSFAVLEGPYEVQVECPGCYGFRGVRKCTWNCTGNAIITGTFCQIICCLVWTQRIGSQRPRKFRSNLCRNPVFNPRRKTRSSFCRHSSA